MATDDLTLVKRVRGGDQRAFKLLVERYQRKVYAVALGMLKDKEEAMDVSQEAFVKVYKYLDHFKGDSSFYTWLYRIMTNLALDRRRREQRAPMLEWDDKVAPRIDPRALSAALPDPEVASRRAEVRAFVAKGVQELPDGQREVLLLREVEGLSYEEIAQKMQISKGTVMSRLHYARKKMIVFLNQHGVEPEDVE